MSDWLINVYLSGDNNLTGDMVHALQGMRFTATNQVRVTAQFDPLGADPRFYSFPEEAPNDQKPLGLSGKLLLDYLQDDAPDLIPLVLGDPEIISNMSIGSAIKAPLGAVTIAASRRPPLRAQVRTYRMVVLSGHGNGAVGEFLKDLSSKSSINTITLCEILGDSLKFNHILGMDSCLMSMAEVCYQASLTEKVGILVGSEGFLVNTGWPYERILEGIVSLNDQRTPDAVAIKIVEKHIRFYADYAVAGISADCSAVKLTDFDWDENAGEFVATGNIFREELVEKFSILVNQLEAKSEANNADGESFRNAVLMAHWQSQCYNDDQYVDVWDFCDQLNAHYRKAFNLEEEVEDEVTQAIAEVKAAVEAVVIRSCYSGSAFQYSHGLSVYFPWALVDYVEAYDDLAFAGATGWHDFLKTFLTATQRPPRPGGGEEQHCASADLGMLVIRKYPPWTKGGISTKLGGTKNHPHAFYASNECADNPAGDGADG